MKLAIVTTPERIEKDKNLVSEANKYFSHVVYTSIDSIKLEVGKELEIFYSRYDLSEFDYVLLIPTVEYKEFFYTALRILENKDVLIPISSEKFFMMWNRPLLLRMLAKQGIKIRKTFAIAQNIVADTIAKELKLPVMITTTKGKRVYVNKRGVLKDVLDLFRPGHMVVIEKPITPESVIWSFVIGEEVVASYERVGNSRRSIVLDEKMKEIALKIRRILGSEYCVVNFIKVGKRLIANNVTLAPDFNLFYEATGKSVSDLLLSSIAERVRSGRNVLEDIIEGMQKLSRWFEYAISNIRSIKKRV